MSKYIGITYPRIFGFGPIMWIWRKICCPRGCHLFDEVVSDRHYLICDACAFEVEIDERLRDVEESR